MNPIASDLELSSNVEITPCKRTEQRAANPEAAAGDLSQGRRSAWPLVPYLLAGIVTVCSMRNISNSTPTLTDAARHAMNGAVIHDWLVSGKWSSPFEYGKQYYAQYPAISLPFHPPGFPVIEALFYLVFGVNIFAARLAIAISAGLSALLLYKLVQATHGSHLVASLSTLFFCSLPMTQMLSTDIMLEMPTMAFILAALHLLNRGGDRWGIARGLTFAMLASAAVWTKQHAAFVGMVPFLLIAIRGRGDLLLRPVLWIASMVFGIACLVLVRLCNPTMPHGGVAGHLPTGHNTRNVLFSNVSFVAEALPAYLGSILMMFAAGMILALLIARFRKKTTFDDNALYLAWTLAALALPLVTWYQSSRYIYFAFPALIVLGMSGLSAICRRLLPARWSAPTLVVVAMLLMIPRLKDGACLISGPGEAAAYTVLKKPQRVLYCGTTDGAFVFGVRSAQPTRGDISVVRGDKLQPASFEPIAFDEFTLRYGIEYVVLTEDENSRPWDSLRLSPTSHMNLETVIPVVCRQDHRQDGQLSIYRIDHDFQQSPASLRVPIRRMGNEVNLDP